MPIEELSVKYLTESTGKLFRISFFYIWIGVDGTMMRVVRYLRWAIFVAIASSLFDKGFLYGPGVRSPSSST